MEAIAAVLGVAAILAMTVLLARRGRRRKQKTIYDVSQLRGDLGLLEGVPLQAAVQRLEAALPAEYMERVQSRLLAADSRLTAAQLACLAYELKRYFLMTLLLRSTPMFSPRIDEVWHEMLMHTREYQRFGEQFCGRSLHHAPEREVREAPGERAWFDWVYAHLFAFAPSSSACWQGFFRYPLDQEAAELLKSGNAAAIKERWFHQENADRYPEVRLTIELLVRQAAEEANRAEPPKRPDRAGASNGFDFSYAAGGMLLYSLADDGEYEKHMSEALRESPLAGSKNGSGCSASGCAASGCAGTDSGADGSGCSSGSSCGSGCGGGGD